jgi:hypothetical protein
MITRNGACFCGDVTFTVVGEPTRIGLCHCEDCRKESGSAFTYFGVWPLSAFESAGETRVHAGRRYCASCASRLFAYSEEEVEVKLGSIESAPINLRPTYELWIKRREPWLQPLPEAEQFEEDRPQT